MRLAHLATLYLRAAAGDLIAADLSALAAGLRAYGVPEPIVIDWCEQLRAVGEAAGGVRISWP